MEILILLLLGGLAYFWYRTRPPRAPTHRASRAAARPLPVQTPDDDDEFLRSVDDQLRHRRPDDG